MKENPKSRGFTLVELSIGIAATALVTASMAAFAVGVSDGWRATRLSASFRVATDATAARLAGVVQGCNYVAGCSGAAADPTTVGWVTLWKLDDFAGVAAGKTFAPRDGVAQSGELAVIEFQPQNGSVWLYESLPYAKLNASLTAQAAQPVGREYLETADFYAQFRVMRARRQLGFLAPPRLLAGPGALKADDPLQPRVVSATFTPSPDPAAAHRLIDYSLVIARGPDTQTITGTIGNRLGKTPVATADIPR